MIKIFRVSGTMKGDKFNIDVSAIDENHAIEKVYANIGSKHGIKRREIKIKNVKTIDVSETKNRTLKQLHGGE